MKALLSVLIVLLVSGVALAGPFLICNPQEGVTHYKITGPEWVANLTPVYPNISGAITAQADGSIRTDVSIANLGTNNITVAACIYDDVWGEQCSSYVPFAFVRPSPASTPQAIRLQK